MGYDMEMIVLKKKSLKEAQKIFTDYTFKDMYLNFLFSRLYPDEYRIPKDEKGRYITGTDINIFKDFFKPKLENDEVIIIDEVIYNKMISWLEEKLKSKTLYDCVFDETLNIYELKEIIRVYRQMKEEDIDYETEFVVYQHNW